MGKFATSFGAKRALEFSTLRRSIIKEIERDRVRFSCIFLGGLFRLPRSLYASVVWRRSTAPFLHSLRCPYIILQLHYVQQRDPAMRYPRERKQDRTIIGSVSFPIISATYMQIQRCICIMMFHLQSATSELGFPRGSCVFAPAYLPLRVPSLSILFSSFFARI